VIARRRRLGPRRATRRFARLRLRPRWLVAGAAIAALVVGAWLWVRDSSLVAVQRVTVTGVRGPDAAAIRAALVRAALSMTTLDVHMSALRSAIAPYPIVEDLRVSTQLPHGLRIRVVEKVPVATVSLDGRAVVVASDGTLLREVAATSSLPSITMPAASGGSRLTDPQTLAAVAVLAAAPARLLARVSEVSSDATHGLVIALRRGPSIYFGDTSALAAKWAAAIDVLADPGSVGASYIDVTDPRRPAAGAPAAAAGATSGAAGATSGAATTAGAGAASASGSVGSASSPSGG
jgi:cell division protein FtsQ